MGPVYRIEMAARDPVARTVLRDFLVRSGHEVVLEISTGEDLMRRRSAASSHLIVTDIGRCRLDRLDVVQDSNRIVSVVE
jgi:DNA-binding NarL/FixJ family response regulator